MTAQLAMDFTPQDVVRLTGLLARVRECMGDGLWHTIPTVADRVGGSETGTSAAMRALRKPANGGHTVERRRHPVLGQRGVYQYRLVVRDRTQ